MFDYEHIGYLSDTREMERGLRTGNGLKNVSVKNR